MSKSKNQSDQPTENLSFFNTFLTNPREVGSIIQSSRFLKKRIITRANVASAKTIVELGPGTGGTTKAILEAMAPDAKLLTIELTSAFMPFLAQIDDDRLINHNGDARDIVSILAQYGLDKPDVVISGIPFTPMPTVIGQAIVNEVWQALREDGRFLTYQFWNKVKTLSNPVFGNSRVEFELLNIPPVQLSYFDKRIN
ncbi:MAG: methyltransferase type 12 [Gammaproteobacteria bacterium]|nr:methyltransferase type 12 [Gammaproteobacteria bacterium]MDH5653469.1 methyltransferase type 12 [Gammaproteobacteria bacterium]